MSARSSALRAVLFDVDGTLAETERLGHLPAFQQAFDEAGLPWRWDDALYTRLLAVTGGRERIAHYAQLHQPRWLALPDADARIAALHRRKNEIYAGLVSSGAITLRPGVVELLDALAAHGWRLGLVTTTSRVNLEVLLAATLGAGALARFDPIVCGEDVTHKKPDPESYELALARAGVDSDDCLAIEDSRAGLLAARSAGLRCAIVRGDYTRGEDFTSADFVADGYAPATPGGLDLAVLEALIA